MRRTELKVGRKSLERGSTFKAARSSLPRHPMKHPGPSLETKQMGGRAALAAKRKAAGIPDDAPKNKHGHSCKEKTCVVCGKTFLAQWSTAWKRKTCSPKCAAAAKRGRSRDRKGERNPNFKHGNDAGRHDRAGRRRFQSGQMYCQHPDCPDPRRALAQHHVCYEQHVKGCGGDRWDPRNALAVCHSCHSSHHQRGRVLPVSALRDENIEFAFELMGPAAYDYFCRYYKGYDPRVQALLFASPNPKGTAASE